MQMCRLVCGSQSVCHGTQVGKHLGVITSLFDIVFGFDSTLFSTDFVLDEFEDTWMSVKINELLTQ